MANEDVSSHFKQSLARYHPTRIKSSPTFTPSINNCNSHDLVRSNSLTNLNWLADLCATHGSVQDSIISAHLIPNHSDYRLNSDVRPPFSFTTILVKALLSAKNEKRTVLEISDWVIRNFPYYRNGSQEWRNTIRHHLTLNKYFRPCYEEGVSKKQTHVYWMLTEEAKKQFNPEDSGKGSSRLWRTRLHKGGNMSLSSEESCAFKSAFSSPAPANSPLYRPVDSSYDHFTPPLSLSSTPSLDSFNNSTLNSTLQGFLVDSMFDTALDCQTSNPFLDLISSMPNDDLTTSLAVKPSLAKAPSDLSTCSTEVDTEQYMSDLCFSTPEEWLL